VDVGTLLVGEGDRATATGRLVRDARGGWFQPPMFMAAPGAETGGYCRSGPGMNRAIGAGRRSRRDLDAQVG